MAILHALALLQLLQLLSSPARAHAVPSHQFDAFFPGWNGMIQDILRNNCSEPYSYYRAGETGPKGEAYMVFRVIECLLQQFPEFRKSEMAASAVILGLLPTTLQNLGSTSAETSLLGLRRPVLALLVSLALRRGRGTLLPFLSSSSFSLWQIPDFSRPRYSAP